MKVTMKETRRGSEDGCSVRCYEQGETYDLADGLARQFLRDGSATRVEECAA